MHLKCLVTSPCNSYIHEPVLTIYQFSLANNFIHLLRISWFQVMKCCRKSMVCLFHSSQKLVVQTCSLMISCISVHLSLQEDDPDGVKVVLQIGSSFLGKKKKKIERKSTNLKPCNIKCTTLKCLQILKERVGETLVSLMQHLEELWVAQDFCSI